MRLQTTPAPLARRSGGERRARPGTRFSRNLRAARDLPRIYAFLLPGLLVYSVFVLYPIVQAFRISLTNWDGNSPAMRFVGLSNYAAMTRDPAVLTSSLHVLVWLAVNITVAPALGIAMAVLVNQRGIAGKGLFRTVFFLPATISAVVIGFIWQWVYNPLYGILDAAFRLASLPGLATDWLGTPGSALLAVAVANSWQNAALFFIFYLAGLQQIPAELHEAAEIEGATGWQVFRHVTLPLLKPTTTTVIALGIIWSLRQFDLVWTMTQGGPGNATETLGTYIYRTAFLFNRMGYSAALSVVLLLLTVAVTLGFMVWRER
jgi:raffinose/stachyose/melibiose transport system permease protein